MDTIITTKTGTKPNLPAECPICGDGHSLTPDTVREDGSVAREYDCGSFFDRDPLHSDPTTDGYSFDRSGC